MNLTLTGKDTIIIDGRTLDLGDGDVAQVAFSNNLVEVTVGKNANALFSENATGNMAVLTLRVPRGNADDKYLNSKLAAQRKDLPGFVVMSGSIKKRLGDGDGNILVDTYTLQGGVIQKMPDVKENVAGDTEQAITVWTLAFANGERVLG